MARPAVWVRLRYRLPNHSGPKSLPCAAPGMWRRRDRLAQTMSLITRGKISREVGSVIDRRYPLSDAAEALRYLEERHAQGKIVLTIEPAGKPLESPAPGR